MEFHGEPTNSTSRRRRSAATLCQSGRNIGGTIRGILVGRVPLSANDTPSRKFVNSKPLRFVPIQINPRLNYLKDSPANTNSHAVFLRRLEVPGPQRFQDGHRG